MSRRTITNKQVKAVDKLATDYLNQNPKIKKAMELFNLSKKQYSASLQAKMPNQTITSSETELNHGILARNQQ